MEAYSNQLNASEIDYTKVSMLLNNLSSELCIPYYIQKSCAKSLNDPVKELEIASQKITQLEQKLNAVVGIARILLTIHTPKDPQESLNSYSFSAVSTSCQSDTVISSPCSIQKEHEELKYESTSCQSDTVISFTCSIQTEHDELKYESTSCQSDTVISSTCSIQIEHDELKYESALIQTEDPVGNGIFSSEYAKEILELLKDENMLLIAETLMSLKDENTLLKSNELSLHINIQELTDKNIALAEELKEKEETLKEIEDIEEELEDTRDELNRNIADKQKLNEKVEELREIIKKKENEAEVFSGLISSLKYETQVSDSWRCQAITRAGTRCKRSAQSGRSYCWQH